MQKNSVIAFWRFTKSNAIDILLAYPNGERERREYGPYASIQAAWVEQGRLEDGKVWDFRWREDRWWKTCDLSD